MVRREDFCLLKFLPLFSGFGGFLNISVLSTCPSLVLALPTRPFLSLFSSAWRVVRPSGVSRQHSVPAGSVVAEFCTGGIWMALSDGRTQRQQRVDYVLALRSSCVLHGRHWKHCKLV